MNARGILLLVSALAGPWLTACGDDQRVRPPPSNPELDAFSKPGTPAPDQADSIQAACSAMLEHEAEGCGGDIAPDAADDCLRTWRAHDARGCGAAYARFIDCRTTSLDCESGWDESCNLYEDAAFICTTEFVQRTSCTPVTIDDLCEAGGYAYACVAKRKPFSECSSVPEIESPAYCCFEPSSL